MTSAHETASLVVVGGGPAALSAVKGYRDHGGTGAVRLITGEDTPPYDRPPLSKFFLTGDRDVPSLPLEDDDFYASNDVTVTLSDPVSAVDTDACTVTTASGETVGYETLVLATGGDAAALPVPGGDHPAVLRLRSLAQAVQLKEAVEAARSVVVIGSGFIGCETAATLAASLGKDVTMIGMEDVPQAERLGDHVGQQLADWLTHDGVTLLGGVTVEGIEDGTTVHLQGRDPVTADLVITATGSAPSSQLAKDAGLETRQGRVVVDAHLRTSVPTVLAAGDVALAHNATADRPVPTEHWIDAQGQGEVAGAVAAGADTTWTDVPYFWTRINGRTLQYAAWGDGFDEVVVDSSAGEHDSSFAVWYGRGGVTVGVLTYEADDELERGTTLVSEGGPLPRA
ncbi:FAD-dependent oxidoreductase [Rhodococcus aerolatus]